MRKLSIDPQIKNPRRGYRVYGIGIMSIKKVPSSALSSHL